MSTTILTSLSTYMSKTSSMTTSKLKFVILKRLNKWKIKKKFRGGSCPGGKCTKVGGGRCHKNRGGRCHKNGGGKCPGGKCNTTVVGPLYKVFNNCLLQACDVFDVKMIQIWTFPAAPSTERVPSLAERVAYLRYSINLWLFNWRVPALVSRH